MEERETGDNSVAECLTVDGIIAHSKCSILSSISREKIQDSDVVYIDKLPTHICHVSASHKSTLGATDYYAIEE